MRKRRQKDLRVSNLAVLLVVFKWHHGSEGVNAAAEVRKAQGNESEGMSDMCCQVPTEYIPNLHGRYMVLQGLYERLQNFQNRSEAGGDVSWGGKFSLYIYHPFTLTTQLSACQISPHPPPKKESIFSTDWEPTDRYPDPVPACPPSVSMPRPTRLPHDVI